LEWNEEGVEGASRFLRRVWKLVAENQDWLADTAPFAGGELAGADRTLRRKVHETVKKVTENIEDRFHFNTAIAAAMELVNELGNFAGRDERGRSVYREAVDALVKLLAPMVPHVAEELWEALGNRVPLSATPWPGWDEAALERDAIVIVVQVSGKVRGRVEVPADAAEDQVRDAALADENVAKHLEGKTLVKAVYVPGRILNLVVR